MAERRHINVSNFHWLISTRRLFDNMNVLKAFHIIYSQHTPPKDNYPSNHRTASQATILPTLLILPPDSDSNLTAITTCLRAPRRRRRRMVHPRQVPTEWLVKRLDPVRLVPVAAEPPPADVLAAQLVNRIDGGGGLGEGARLLDDVVLGC
jgi:hypothetical protein